MPPPQAAAPAFAPGAPRAAVAAAHPLAAEAGRQILDAGGNAVDAAVATAFALAVVEPQASGIGGGGFALVHDATTGRQVYVDYREKAPSALTEAAFTTDGKLDADRMKSGGNSVAVPGMSRGLLALHERHGRLPRAAVLAPAQRLAAEGFQITPGMVGHIESRLDALMANPPAAEIFLVDGIFAPEAGHTLVQPALANTIGRLATEGDAAVYTGAAAEAIAAAVRADGGVMTAADIEAFQPRWRDTITTTYRGHQIVTVAPPSSGGIQVIQALMVLEGADVAAMGPDSPEYLALLIAALESAQSSVRDRVADPAFVDIDYGRLLSPDWATMVRARVAPAGRPAPMYIQQEDTSSGNTTHLSVVDAEGNAVALTQTINSFFGAGLLVPELGILLNNEMSDFDFEAGSPNIPAANKIPRSSMCPVLVFKDGRLLASLGTPGGPRIPSAMVQILVNTIDFGMGLQDAISAPRLHVDARLSRVSFEEPLGAERVEAAAALVARARPFRFQKYPAHDKYFGGAQGVWIHETAAGLKLEAAADPRREGSVVYTAAD